MGMMKYAIYIGIILIVALCFQQIMTFLYDLTLQGVAGQLNAYLILLFIWIFLYIVAKLLLDKKVHPKSSKYALWGGMLHIGAVLAVYFSNSNPFLLLIYPAILGIVVWTRQKRPHTPKFGLKLHISHPLFIDNRGGIGVLRTGCEGFLLLKFFRVDAPFPVKELLLYCAHEQLECTFEVRGTPEGLEYGIGLSVHGRRYDLVYQKCMDRANRLRQFLKKIDVSFTELSDYLNVLTRFYAPYFLYTPMPLTKNGLPQVFPQLSIDKNDLTVESDLEDCTFAIHRLKSTFPQNADLYPFLEGVTERFCLQFHLTPLNAVQLDAKEVQLNTEYSATLKRLTKGLEENTEFQAASYLFTKTEDSKENLEPLLNRTELECLKSLKQRLRQLKAGRTIGLWETEFYLICSTSLAQALAIKIGGTAQVISPHTLPYLASRARLGEPTLVDSRDLSVLLPNLKVQKLENIQPIIETDIPPETKIEQ